MSTQRRTPWEIAEEWYDEAGCNILKSNTRMPFTASMLAAGPSQGDQHSERNATGRWPVGQLRKSWTAFCCARSNLPEAFAASGVADVNSHIPSRPFSVPTSPPDSGSAGTWSTRLSAVRRTVRASGAGTAILFRSLLLSLQPTFPPRCSDDSDENRPRVSESRVY